MTNSEQILHYPKLDTIMMVEETIRKMHVYPSKRQLCLALPRKVMYQTLQLILNYLEKSGKILMCKDGRIVWTWNPSLLAQSVPVK
jgi:hypothetical protein